MLKIVVSKLFLLLLGAAIFISLSSVNVFAQIAPPSFPSCLNPQGEVTSSFSDGIHGIPGNTQSFSGNDIVYTVTPTTVLQCFCSPTGDGIQSDWWKVTDLTPEQIQTFVTAGWVFVPDGSVWGLDAAPYLVQNISFTCSGPSGGPPGNSSPGPSSSSPSSSNGSSSSSSNGTVGEVLGLASTGNIVVIASWFALGFVLTAVGLLLRKLHQS